MGQENGGMVLCLNCSQIVLTTQQLLSTSVILCLAQEAKDVSGTDPNGRWWAFKVTPETLVILEKKTCPDHLQNLGCLDTCTTLQQVLREIQDSGEARLKSYLDANNGREHGFKYATTL